MEEDIIYNLRKSIWETEKAANHNQKAYVGQAKEIRVHPRDYFKILSHPDAHLFVNLWNGEPKTFMGIPLVEDYSLDEDGWKIVL